MVNYVMVAGIGVVYGLIFHLIFYFAGLGFSWENSLRIWAFMLVVCMGSVYLKMEIDRIWPEKTGDE